MTYNIYTWEYPDLMFINMSGPHRDCTYFNLVAYVKSGYTVKVNIDGIVYGVCQLSYDEKWWIVPLKHDDEALADDIGPYDTMEEALTIMKLSGIPTYDH